jgi:hypothetical protein
MQAHYCHTSVVECTAGGPNGSLGVGCNSETCCDLGTALVSLPTATCPNGLPPVSGFTDRKSYCCPAADECIAHGQADNLGPGAGKTVPVCLKGSPDTVELCRRENDNLLPTIQVSHILHSADHWQATRMFVRSCSAHASTGRRSECGYGIHGVVCRVHEAHAPQSACIKLPRKQGTFSLQQCCTALLATAHSGCCCSCFSLFCFAALPAAHMYMLPQAFRGRQADPNFQWGPAPAKKPLSFADIIVAAAVVAVQQCSGQALRIPHTMGRPEALVADSQMLPSPGSIIEDKHFSVFQQMVRLIYCSLTLLQPVPGWQPFQVASHWH